MNLSRAKREFESPTSNWKRSSIPAYDTRVQIAKDTLTYVGELAATIILSGAIIGIVGVIIKETRVSGVSGMETAKAGLIMWADGVNQA